MAAVLQPSPTRMAFVLVCVCVCVCLCVSVCLCLCLCQGMTSNELWDMHRRGARLIKLFHASILGPKILRSMLSVGPLKRMNIAPSGGCSPENATEWWDAGAVCIGMGSNLTGKDITHPADTPGYEQGRELWQQHGKAIAQTLFDTIRSRFP